MSLGFFGRHLWPEEHLQRRQRGKDRQVGLGSVRSHGQTDNVLRLWCC
jgi:hypothetical protein